ncbi:hypothetical protein R1flu_005783 [Riccia fluitans]|uniref:Uncharacterized protein n=1 Tax=Riccia fluitans TaxID=41844 RepID=A0ABD1YV24_9MARC
MTLKPRTSGIAAGINCIIHCLEDGLELRLWILGWLALAAFASSIMIFLDFNHFFSMALARSPHLSSGGPLGMVFELLRDCFTPQDPTSGFDLLFDLCTHIAQGRVFPSTAYLLGASRLLALEKPSGSVRPIVMEEVLHRLVACTLGFQFREALVDHFSPLQFGVATRGGCETIIHGLRATLDLHLDWVVL